MAKQLAARAAWSNADASLRIHGGNGYALEYEISRILCDAHILNIFEGAAEIQAQVIARGLYDRKLAGEQGGNSGSACPGWVAGQHSDRAQSLSTCVPETQYDEMQPVDHASYRRHPSALLCNHLPIAKRGRQGVTSSRAQMAKRIDTMSF